MVAAVVIATVIVIVIAVADRLGVPRRVVPPGAPLDRTGRDNGASASRRVAPFPCRARVDGVVHVAGQPIAGALWHGRDALGLRNNFKF